MSDEPNNTPSPVFAGFFRRKFAYGIDAMILFVLCTLISWLGGGEAQAQTAADIEVLKRSGWLLAGTDTGALLEAAASSSSAGGLGLPSGEALLMLILISLVVSAVYNIGFVASYWRATPGKHWCGLKVVRADGEPLTLTESTARHVASGLSSATLGLGYLMICFTREKCALHDLICGTRVIRERRLREW